MSYKFILADNILPITPNEIRITINNKNKTIDIINLGEANILKMPGLSTIEFKFVAPAFKYPYVTNYQPQIFYYDLLEKLKVGQKPFIFSVIRQLPTGRYTYPSSFNVSMEDYSIVETTDEGFDVARAISSRRYDMISLGYGYGVVLLKDDAIAIMHDLNKGNVQQRQVSITYKGHSHKSKNSDKEERVFYVPSLSDVNMNTYEYSPLVCFLEAEYQFYDADFDGEDELIIGSYVGGPHGSPCYDIYDMTDSRLVQKRADDGFSSFWLDSDSEFDSENKQIRNTIYEGAYAWGEYIFNVNEEGQYHLLCHMYFVSDFDHNIIHSDTTYYR